MSRKLNHLRASAAAGVLIALLAGCGDDTSNTSSSDTTSPPTTPTTLSAGGSLPQENPQTSASVPADNPTSHLTDVKADVVTGHDRVVFTFQDTVPGYSLEYVEPKDIVNTAGSTVPVAGGNSLRIVLSNASGASLADGYKQIYTGPKRFTATGTSVVTELAQVEDFEAQLQWVVGTKTKAPFTVTADPALKTVTVLFF